MLTQNMRAIYVYSFYEGDKRQDVMEEGNLAHLVFARMPVDPYGALVVYETKVL